MRIFEASELYQKEETPLIVIAGKVWDWIIKGLGCKRTSFARSKSSYSREL